MVRGHLDRAIQTNLDKLVEGNGSTAGSPATWHAMASYWYLTANFEGLKLPKGLDLSKLDALIYLSVCVCVSAIRAR